MCTGGASSAPWIGFTGCPKRYAFASSNAFHRMIFVLEMMLPFRREPFFGKKPIQQILDAVGCFVRRARTAAAGLCSTFLECCHPSIFPLK
jgi:hypothetical protein